MDYSHISYIDRSNDTLKHAYYDTAGWSFESIASTPFPALTAGQTTSIAIDSKDNIHIAAFGQYLRYDGNAWLQEPAAIEAFPSMVLDAYGYPHICSVGATSNELMYSYYDGSIWRTQPVDSNGDFMSTSLAFDSSGNPHISYTEWITQELRYASYDGSGWHIQKVDSGGWFRTSLSIDASDKPHIAYAGSGWALKYAHFESGSWIVEPLETGYGGFVSIALDAIGHPHISYYGGETLGSGTLKYAYNDGGSWAMEAVDSAAFSGYHSSLS